MGARTLLLSSASLQDSAHEPELQPRAAQPPTCACSRQKQHRTAQPFPHTISIRFLAITASSATTRQAAQLKSRAPSSDTVLSPGKESRSPEEAQEVIFKIEGAIQDAQGALLLELIAIFVSELLVNVIYQLVHVG